MTGEDILEALKSFKADIDLRFDKIDKELNVVKDKCSHIEQRLETALTNQPSGEGIHKVTLVTSIGSSEDKIKQLNEIVDISKQEDIIEAIRLRCTVDESSIRSVLKQDVSIYDMVVDIIYEFDSESEAKYLYGFPSSKSVMFYWCHEKQTWTKLTKGYLQKIFEAVQMKMIRQYQIMLSQDSQIKKECVENGDYIYADNFDKKYATFRKALFSRFV